MSVITLRSTKGSPLTNAEMDLNFSHLNSDKMEKASNFADIGNVNEAKTNLDLELVDNTRDADKPVSIAAATALALVADSIPLTVIAERITAATLTNKTLTDPVINGFTGTALQKSANAIGYNEGTGTGAAITQLTSKGTDVVLDKPTGQITLHAASLAAAAVVSFNCTTSHCDATDTVVANIQANGTTTETAYLLQAFPSAGSILFTLRNLSAGALAEALVINFSIIKGSAT